MNIQIPSRTQLSLKCKVKSVARNIAGPMGNYTPTDQFQKCCRKSFLEMMEQAQEEVS